MNVLSLFAGIGGFDLGLERSGMRIVAQCEFDPFCQKVLAKHWPDVPCYPDVRELTKEVLIHDGIMADTIRIAGAVRGHDSANTPEGGVRRAHAGGSRGDDCGQLGTGTNGTNGGAHPSPGPIDLICGGYPCQPFSHAGKRAGAEDDRHLWPEMFRLIETIRPRWVLAENVAGHISMGLDDVLSDLEGAGYAWWAFVIPACAVDARHRRDRVWIVGADAMGNAQRKLRDGRAGEPGRRQKGRVAAGRPGEDVADSINAGLEGYPRNGYRGGQPGRQQEGPHGPTGAAGLPGGGTTLWEPEPDVGRVADGIPDRVDRLKALGNAVVPQVVEVIGRAIMECES